MRQACVRAGQFLGWQADPGDVAPMTHPLHCLSRVGEPPDTSTPNLTLTATPTLTLTPSPTSFTLLTPSPRPTPAASPTPTSTPTPISSPTPSLLSIAEY